MDSFLQVLVIGSMVLVGGAFLLKFTKELLDTVGIATYGMVRLSNAHRTTLERWNPFYKNLDVAGRKLFDRRVKGILYEKDWVGKGIAVTWEMKVRIAGAMAQVTFGFDNLLLLHFKRIFILPGEFTNPRTGQRQVGEVIAGRGAIVLSWASFQQGYAQPDDALNVGLHEMAHALWLGNAIDTGEDHFMDAATLQRWQVLAQGEIDRINTGRGHFFRTYAGTNQAEFFAVAVEYFFEQPVAFKDALPEVYGCLGRLLRQDPSGRIPASAPVQLVS